MGDHIIDFDLPGQLSTPFIINVNKLQYHSYGIQPIIWIKCNDIRNKYYSVHLVPESGPYSTVKSPPKMLQSEYTKVEIDMKPCVSTNTNWVAYIHFCSNGVTCYANTSPFSVDVIDNDDTELFMNLSVIDSSIHHLNSLKSTLLDQDIEFEKSKKMVKFVEGLLTEENKKN